MAKKINIPADTVNSEINQKKVLKEIKAIIKEIGRLQKSPIYLNTIIMVINSMPEFVGPRVPFCSSDLDPDNIMETLEDAIRIRTGLPPENSGIQKVFIAAFVSDLDKTLVDNGEITEEEYQKQLEEFLRNGRK